MLLELASYLAKLSRFNGVRIMDRELRNPDTSQGIVPEVINVGPS